MLFTDNFDYQTVRDLIKGILDNDDVSMHKIYMGIICGEYAARVSNFQTYDAISRDMIHRWTYPIVPDIFATVGADGDQVVYKRNHIYLRESVILAR